MLLIALLCACSGDDEPAVSTPTDPVGPTGPVDTDTVTGTPTPPPLDLAERLPAGAARAGVVDDPAALFSGISAEGRPGDVKIYNDRVQFIIQGVREGSYYLPEGGGVIDADIVRPEGELGRDLIDEWGSMVGLGRVLVPDEVEVVSDGRDGGPALVRVTGHEDGLGLLEGVLEAEGFVKELGIDVVTEYELPPDSWLLTVRTTVRAVDDDVSFTLGDLLLGAPEVASPFTDGTGFRAGNGTRRWTGYASNDAHGAALMIPPPGEAWGSNGFELITELADMAVNVSPLVELEEGEEATVTRFWGVGPDLATLTDAALELHGTPTTSVSGVVTAEGAPVPYARVTLLEDGAPLTVAIADDQGAFEVQAPSGSDVTARASGRGTGRFTDLPPGAVPFAPYAASLVQDQVLDALGQGASGPVFPQGLGIASAASPLELVPSARIHIVTDDASPFLARLAFVGGDPVEADGDWVLPRPGGLSAAGWTATGELGMDVEPGEYQLTVHRGIRHERHVENLMVASGDTHQVDVDLAEAVRPTGWLLADPHSHASPSPDGQIPMEERLLVQASAGVQVHFGTDHDHLADYRPLVDATALTGHLVSVVADEVSPPLRGHMNIYPVTPDTEAPNNGAWRWWSEIPDSTEDIVDRLRSRHGPDFILQSNHPLDSGVPGSAGWSPGHIDDGDYFTERFDAMEVLNAADTEDYLDVWWDLVLRGYAITPTGVSDSHSHFGGSPGLSATWMYTGGELVDLTDDDVSEVFRAGRVVVTRGPFLDLSVLPGDVAAGTELTVEALAPSWIVVDRVQLWRDGALVEEVTGTAATFTLSPDDDALYVVVAEGDTSMAPVSSRTPWAMTAPYRVDVDGDGFDPPLPPLVIE